MIPITKYAEVQAIASISFGNVDKPRHDDIELMVRFTNADDKHTFVDNWNKVKPKDMKLVKTNHGLTAKVEILTYGA